MKKSKLQLLLVGTTILSLLIMLILQLNWVYRMANMNEKQFNKSVKIALGNIVDHIASDTSMCKSVSMCMDPEQGKCCFKKLQEHNWKIVDEIIRKELNDFDIDLNYTFEIVDTSLIGSAQTKKAPAYMACMASALRKKGVQLQISFPDKTVFIRKQMGSAFMLSVLVIFLLSFSFFMVFRFYRKELQLSEDIKDFINNIIHEFKTPLTNISLAGNRLATTEEVKNNPRLHTYTKIIQEEHNKLRQRVEEILYAAVLDNGSEINCTQVDLKLLLEEVKNSFSEYINQREGEIILSADEGEYKLYSNRDVVALVFTNLLDNAVKYTQRKPLIKIDIHKKDAEICVQVSDNGIGIQAENMGKIFDKFYRVSTGNIHDVKGFGIGLWNVKKALEHAGGRISVKSEWGKGTIFTVCLPDSKRTADACNCKKD